MPVEQNFIAFQESVACALRASEDRIRHLIGGSHWLTDGEHKESLLRDTISEFSPEMYRVGAGFICYPAQETSSGQIDILITHISHPTLYKRSGLHFVTADSVAAIVEVKTKLSRGEKLDNAIRKLSTQINGIRRTRGFTEAKQRVWAGLFIYDEGDLNPEDVLESLRKNTVGYEDGAINCVAVGHKFFIRFWENGHSETGLENGEVWHSYNLQSLSHSYFISNLIARISPSISEDNAQAWFPITGAFGKVRLMNGHSFLDKPEFDISIFEDS
ncbi:hypothetical protein ABWK96_004474 [Vibrio parahaemolyticus]|uniref:DUF6602 domain-containing protein n=1 Tax=Vibrio parahaemolyticus TaxID=670 RepID=UPI00084AE5B4|nr:DUF6602 domain-containing protein [Vibrio parahaemolyticus]EGR1879828.1 hypothetical protein [Vibrio parahaemolyticus]EIA1349987.1 hypothetical protein [Vibrio parahaemolyticus]EIV8502310.1 hypothetical protein [Vibrio parahaemolyticus]EJC7061927.1 hypothetical protein [Vibrio parahaemolyticus]EJE4537608.1 hypothetical protein [Vibrio parahaemolyticus]